MSGSFVNRLGDSPEEGIKAPVVKVTSTDVPLSGLISGVVAGNRVLVAGQTDITQNGIYNASESAWTRATDFNAANDTVNGVLVLDSETGDIYQAVFEGAWSPDVTEITFRNVIRLGEVVSEEFVRKTGDNMTGNLNMRESSKLKFFKDDDVQYLESYTDGWRWFDDLGNEVIQLVQTTGVRKQLQFSEATPDGTIERVLVLDADQVARLSLGTTYPATPDDLGYNHYNLYFSRSEETATPYFRAMVDSVVQAQVDGSGGAMFSDQLAVWDYETSNTSAYGMYTSSGAEGVEALLIISPVVNDPLSPETVYTYTGEVHIETISETDPLAVNVFNFQKDGQLILPQQPTEDMSAITKSWAIANLGGGSGSLPVGALGQVLWHNGTQWTVVPLAGFAFDVNGIFTAGATSAVKHQFNIIDRDGTRWDLMDISLVGAATHELVLAHQNQDTPSAISLVTNTGDLLDQNSWRFLPNGDFVAPGDIIIDSQGSNAGSLEIRNYEPGTEAWFGMYVTNDAGTDDGMLIIQPAHESGSGSPEWYAGGVRLISNSTSGSNAGINQWDFKSNGDFVAPGDIIIDSTGANSGSFEMRNYEQVGLPAWFGMYVTNDAGTDDGMLIIQPAHESLGGAPEWYAGGVRLISNSTSGSNAGINQWDFKSNGDFVAPGDIIIDSTGANSGSFEMRNYEQVGNIGWWGMYATNAAVEDSMFIIQPARETGPGVGEFYSGAFRIVTNPTPGSTVDLRQFDFKSNGDFVVPGNLLIDPDLTSGGGSIGVRTYQTGAAYWYQMYATRDSIDGAQASFLIEPGSPDGGVIPSGNVRIITKGPNLHSFDFTKQGNFIVPGDLKIQSDSSSGGSLGIRAYSGVSKWYQMYVAAGAVDGADATLVIEPVNPDGGANTGNVQIVTRNNGGFRTTTFEKNGDLTLPRVINLSSAEAGGLYWSAHSVVGNTTGLYMDSTQKVVMRNGAHSLTVDNTGLYTATTSQLSIGPSAPTASNHAARKSYVDAAVSDVRLKCNVISAHAGLDEILRLRPVQFDYTNVHQKRGYHKQRYGLIAQEVQGVLPDAVHILSSDADEQGRSISGENYLGLDLAELVPVLINAVRELHHRIQSLEACSTQ